MRRSACACLHMRAQCSECNGMSACRWRVAGVTVIKLESACLIHRHRHQETVVLRQCTQHTASSPHRHAVRSCGAAISPCQASSPVPAAPAASSSCYRRQRIHAGASVTDHERALVAWMAISLCALSIVPAHLWCCASPAVAHSCASGTDPSDARSAPPTASPPP